MSTHSIQNRRITNQRADWSERKAAITIAVLFLLATATFMAGDGLIVSAISSPNYLEFIHINSNRLIWGVLLEFADAAAIVGIGVVIYPILKKHNSAIASGYVATRIIECMTLVIGGISLLLLTPLSQAFVQATAANASYLQSLADLLVAQSGLAFQVAMLALGIGSIPFCYLLYQTNLIPQPLSLLGLIGYAALAIGMVLGILGIIEPTQGIGMMTMVLGGLFELILPFWLLAKGFNTLEKKEEKKENEYIDRWSQWRNRPLAR